jgi:hypothetical protein
MANSLNQDLHNKKVELKNGSIFFCESGFGCFPHTIGKKIFGDFLPSEVSGAISGYDVKKIIEGE